MDGVFDWARIREVVTNLRLGKPGRWHAFDFMRGLSAKGVYRLKNEVMEIASAPVVLLEGAYSASPKLRNLVDIIKQLKPHI